MKLKTRDICMLGFGIALYVVLSATVKIPLIGHIQTDLGYIAFGAYLMIFGTPAIVVGAVGCVVESLLFSGWMPVGWLIGQIVIGAICGVFFKKSQKIKSDKLRIVFCILMSIIALLIGIFFVKTIIECYLYQIPFVVQIHTCQT